MLCATFMCEDLEDESDRNRQPNRWFVDSPLEGTGFELLVRGRGEAMTSVTASPRPRLPRSLAFGVVLLSPRCLPGTCCIVDQAKIAQPTAPAATNSLPRSPLPPTTPANASPSQAAGPSNPHRRQPSTRRPAGCFLGGFRTPASERTRIVTTGRHPKPFT